MSPPHEIAVYGTLVTWAKQLALENEAELLGETLQEEKATDESLTTLAESWINESAASE